MPRLFRLLLPALLVMGALPTPPTGAAGYQRTRNVWSDGSVPVRHGEPYASAAPYQQRHYSHAAQGYGAYGGQVSGSYYQRPYPYHLDYYRMRWGGSYAPYFGNLYGPPNVVLGGPPYYYGGGYPVPYEVPYEQPPVVAP